MVFHGNIPIWVMITSHVLSWFYVFLFSCNAGNEGVNCAWDGGLGGNNDEWTNQYPYLKDGRTDKK